MFESWNLLRYVASSVNEKLLRYVVKIYSDNLIVCRFLFKLTFCHPNLISTSAGKLCKDHGFLVGLKGKEIFHF